MKRGLFLFTCLLGVIAIVLTAGNDAAMIQHTPHSMPSVPTVYGRIVDRDVDHIKGAIIERVAIFPQENKESSQTIRRNGILVRYPNATSTILICHGFMCDKFDVTFLRNMFPQGTYNIMTFDFRAHGECVNGQFCTFGRDEAYDVIAAAHFLREHPALKGKPLFGYGFSMGAVASIEAQAKDASLFDAMVLDCPFDSSENIIRRCIANLKLTVLGYELDFPCKDFLQQYAFHPYVQALVKSVLRAVANMDAKNIATNLCAVCPKNSIKKVSIPCFFIHCKNDEKVPTEAVRSVFDGAACKYKQLWLTNGRRHFDSFFYNPERYSHRVNKFLTEVLNGNIYKKNYVNKVTEDLEDIGMVKTNNNEGVKEV